jgi:vacuolar-type H+-ATPase subunit E/Vma4
MRERDTILDAQVQSMTEYLRRYEVAQIERQLDESHRIAAEIIRNAHRRARERMRTRFLRERRRMRDAEQSASARVATRNRLAKHTNVNNLIDTAWHMLPDALEQRWKDKSARTDWCDMMLQQTFRALPGPAILVEHPKDWDRKERQAFVESIHQHYGRLPKARADAGLRAGLRICSDQSCLDGSPTGLLAQRSRVAAELLRQLMAAGEAIVTERRHG